MQRRRCCPERALNSRAELTRCCRPRLNLTGRLTPGTPTAPRRSRARPCCPAEREAGRACAPARFRCATGCLGRHDRRQERDRARARRTGTRRSARAPRHPCGSSRSPRIAARSRPTRHPDRRRRRCELRRGDRSCACASRRAVLDRLRPPGGGRHTRSCSARGGGAHAAHEWVDLESLAIVTPSLEGRSRGTWGERRNASEATPGFIRYFVRFKFPIYAPELECICYAESTRAGVNELETVMHPLLHENARPC